MSQVIREGDRLVLDLTDGIDVSHWRGINLQFLSPLLLGLLLPLIAINAYAPAMLSHVKLPIFFFLLAMFAICAGLFFYTSHFPGTIHALVAHREEHTLELVWCNMISTTSQYVPFSDITALRARNAYDDDGYVVHVAELVLLKQAPLVLPEGIKDEQLRPLRAAIGLG